MKLILLSHTPLSVPHLSAQPQGPSCSFSTPGFPFFFSPTSKIHWLAAPIEIELDKFKRRGRGSINGQQGDRMGKRQTQIVSGWTERMSSVSAGLPPCTLCAFRDKKRAHSHFPPLHRLPCYVLIPCPPHTCSCPVQLPAFLSSRPLHSHATGRVAI